MRSSRVQPRAHFTQDLSCVAPYVPPLDSSAPYHVFQILLDDERRPIIFTTPTTLAGGIAIAPPVLAEGTQNSRDSVANQGQTSCTKRTKLSFVATTLGGDLLNVSAVLLRHGAALPHTIANITHPYFRKCSFSHVQDIPVCFVHSNNVFTGAGSV
jgi:hypothetical protein